MLIIKYLGKNNNLKNVYYNTYILYIYFLQHIWQSLALIAIIIIIFFFALG